MINPINEISVMSEEFRATVERPVTSITKRPDILDPVQAAAFLKEKGLLYSKGKDVFAREPRIRIEDLDCGL